MTQEATDLRNQIRALNKQLKEIDPRARAKGTRGADSFNKLLELKQMGKDIKNVGWANSRASAQEQFNAKPEKYEGWNIMDNKDIDGDGANDVILYDARGVPVIINGQTLKRSGHPVRKIYFEENATPAQRKQYNKGIKEGTQSTYKTKLNKIKVERDESGNISIAKAHPMATVKISPYKVFAQKFYKPIWNYLKQPLTNLTNADKMDYYRKFLGGMWSAIKNNAYELLGLIKPASKEDQTYTESRKDFKEQLKTMVMTLLQNPDIFYDDALNIIIQIEPKFKDFINQNSDEIREILLNELYDNYRGNPIELEQSQGFKFGGKPMQSKLKRIEDPDAYEASAFDVLPEDEF